MELAIGQVRSRQLRTDNGFWTVFHDILGLGPSVTLEEPLTGRKVNFSGLYQTHPPTAERIARLRNQH